VVVHLRCAVVVSGLAERVGVMSLPAVVVVAWPESGSLLGVAELVVADRSLAFPVLRGAASGRAGWGKECLLLARPGWHRRGVVLDTYRPRTDPGGGGYLLCLARMHPDKGIDLAIAAARRAGRRLVIAVKGMRGWARARCSGLASFVGEGRLCCLVGAPTGAPPKRREEAEHAYYHHVIIDRAGTLIPAFVPFHIYYPANVIHSELTTAGLWSTDPEDRLAHEQTLSILIDAAVHDAAAITDRIYWAQDQHRAT
jgi:glycosyltransferase involved in cell wall biosynthesis